MKKLLLTLLLLLAGYITYAQDLIMLKTGDEIENVKVLDTLESVIYRNGTQAATIAKSDVLWIKYSNGIKVKLNANVKPAQTVVAPPKAEVPAKKADPAPPVTLPKTEQPVKKDPDPSAQKAPEIKAEDDPNDDKIVTNIISGLDKKLKSSGDNRFSPRKFGLGANVSLTGSDNIGASILMALSSRHFRVEFEFGFANNNTYTADLDEEYGIYKFGLGFYGMTQRDRVNLYIGTQLQGLYQGYDGEGSGVFNIIPTIGGEYGLSNHFTIGTDVGIAFGFAGGDGVGLNTRSRFILRFYF